MRAFKNRASTKRRREGRLVKLLAGLAALKIPITTTRADPDAPDRLLFSANVGNRYDDGDPTTLERFVLVSYEDARFASDYTVHTMRTLRGLRSEINSRTEEYYVVAFDLDANKVMRTEFVTKVRFERD